MLQPIQEEIRQPIGNKKAGFSPFNIGKFRFYARISIIRKKVIKSAPIRPVFGTVPKIEYAQIEP